MQFGKSCNRRNNAPVETHPFEMATFFVNFFPLHKTKHALALFHGPRGEALHNNGAAEKIAHDFQSISTFESDNIFAHKMIYKWQTGREPRMGNVLRRDSNKTSQLT